MNGENQKMTLQELTSTINAEISAGLKQDGEQPENPADDNLKQLGRFICVQVAGTEMAIKLSSVIEAGELSSIRQLPLLPAWLPGIANIRGHIVSVVDLGNFLELAPPLSAGRQSFLMVSKDSQQLAVTVKRILHTRILYQRKPEQISPAEDVPFTPFLSGQAWYEQDGKWQSLALFDLEGFLSSKKLQHIAN